MTSSTHRRVTLAVALAVFIAACGGSSSPRTGVNSSSTPAGLAGVTTSSAPASGAKVSGSLETSGAITGTWHWQDGLSNDCTSVTITLDGSPDTFGSFEVKNPLGSAAGQVTFTSGKLPGSATLRGLGGKLDMPKSFPGPCKISADNVVVKDTSGQVTMTLSGSFTIQS